MTPSLPCQCCGRVDDLDNINPTGIMLSVLVQWECPCSNTRTVHKDKVSPRILRAAEALMDPPGMYRAAGAM